MSDEAFITLDAVLHDLAVDLDDATAYGKAEERYAVGRAALSRLESQNQALQEDKDELYAEREEDARRIAALQERADRAEALLRRIMDEGLYEDATHALIEVYFASAPSPSEESGE